MRKQQLQTIEKLLNDLMRYISAIHSGAKDTDEWKDLLKIQLTQSYPEVNWIFEQEGVDIKIKVLGYIYS